MSQEILSTAVLNKLKQSFYRGPVRSFLSRTGLKPYVKSIYHSGLLLTLDEFRTCEVAGVAAKYRITSIQEHTRISDLNQDSLLRRLLSDIEPDDIVYDVGANVGRVSCLASQKLTDGELVAFEPHPRNVERLRENLSLNTTDATVTPVALSGESGSIELTHADESSGIGGPAISGGQSRNTTVVDMETGDGLIEAGEIPAPTFLHLDVEGAELKVVRGLEQALRRGECRKLYCSVHVGDGNSLSDHGDSPEELHETLERYGFELEVVEHDDPDIDNYYLIASKKSE